MEGELQELKDLVAQLRTDNERLQQEQSTAVPGPSSAPLAPTVPGSVMGCAFLFPIGLLYLPHPSSLAGRQSHASQPSEN